MNDNTVQSERRHNQKVLPWAIWLCASIFYLYQFIVRVSPSVIAEDLMRELSLQAAAFGALASFYYYGYTGMQIPVGLMLDRYGVRAPLTVAGLVCGAGCFIFAATDSLAIMSMGRLLMGIGSAFGFLSCVKTASVWFPPNRLAFFIGMSMLLGTTGGAGGGAPLAALVSYMDWRDATMVLGCVGIIIAVVAALVVRDRPGNLASFGDKRKEGKKFPASILNSISAILKNSQTYLFGLYGALMYTILSGFTDLWGVPYICTVYGVDNTTAAGSISLIYVGIGLGSPCFSWIADRLQSHKRLMMMGAALLGALVTGIIYLPHVPFSATYGLFFLCGVFASSQFLAFVSVCEINASDSSATASGVHNMMCMMSGVIFQPVIGYLLDLSWNGAFRADGMPLYTQEDYQFALSIIPISIAASGILTLFMKETYVK